MHHVYNLADPRTGAKPNFKKKVMCEFTTMNLDIESVKLI